MGHEDPHAQRGEHVSADTRELEMFAYRVRKYVGESSPRVRERIFDSFAWAGATLDRSRNDATIDRDGVITTADSRTPVWVIPTAEGRMMAREVADT